MDEGVAGGGVEEGGGGGGEKERKDGRERMKIAWRYERLGKVGERGNIPPAAATVTNTRG